MSFPEARKAYARGENVTQHLQRQLNVDRNTPEIIEIAYDIQAGSYADFADRNPDALRSFTSEAAKILERYLGDADSILDVGCGELTTFSHLVNNLGVTPAALFAFDLSWSRIRVGRSYASSHLNRFAFDRLSLFTAEISEIPLLSKSVDVVVSSHALEPNGGREKELLAEVLRVARRYAVLFEPSYELNTSEGRARMESLGYIRGLESAAQSLGATVEDVIPLHNVSNKLNPTAAFIIRPAEEGPMFEPGHRFADPGGNSPLQRYDTFFFSPERGVSYPIIDGIPILRSSAAVLTSAIAAQPQIASKQ
jgi:SAM-dependent methyltransferase